VTHAMILQASISPERDTTNKLIQLYSSLRQAWQVCEKQIAADGDFALPAPPTVSATVEAPHTGASAALATRSNWRGWTHESEGHYRRRECAPRPSAG